MIRELKSYKIMKKEILPLKEAINCVSRGCWSLDGDYKEMSDEEYEHRISQIFELFGNTRTPHERFYHSMNMGCFE